MTESPNPQPLHGKNGPSLSGYRRGCRCAACKKLKREDNAAYRAQTKLKDRTGVADLHMLFPPEVEAASVSLDWSAEPGLVEATLVEELDKLIGEPPFKKTLIVLGRYNARVLDQIPRIDRPDLISGMQSRLFNVFDRLRRTETAAGATDSWDMSALLEADE